VAERNIKAWHRISAFVVRTSLQLLLHCTSISKPIQPPLCDENAFVSEHCSMSEIALVVFDTFQQDRGSYIDFQLANKSRGSQSSTRVIYN